MEMPSLNELIFNPVTYVILGFYGLLMIWERIAPARKLPGVSLWPLKGLLMFALFFLISSYLPYLTDAYLSRFQLIDLSSWGTWGGALAGFLSYEILGYFWHRSMHESDRLWKLFHQMHHSPERLDSFSAYYFSPLDMIGWTLVTSVSLVLVIGITPEAALVTVMTLSFFGLFTHANIRTPYWLGFLIQRPESHAIHHQRGVHRYNYAELPLIDMLGGTFRNPKTRDIQTGFYEGGSDRISDMLRFRDISEIPADARIKAPK